MMNKYLRTENQVDVMPNETINTAFQRPSPKGEGSCFPKDELIVAGKI
jgi:hypothetical protein